jgi:hypothetical protein
MTEAARTDAGASIGIRDDIEDDVIRPVKFSRLTIVYRRKVSFSDDFDKHALLAASIEFTVKDLFPRPEI